MSLDILFRSLANSIQAADSSADPLFMQSLAAADPSEAQIYSAKSFIDSVYGDPQAERGRSSRAQTPVVSSRAQTPLVCSPFQFPPQSPLKARSPGIGIYSSVPRPIIGHFDSERGSCASTVRLLNSVESDAGGVSVWPAPKKNTLPSQLPFWRTHKIKRSEAKSQSPVKETPTTTTFSRRHMPPRPSTFPQTPDVSEFVIDMPEDEEYAVLISMYEVYNDRIFDLLSPSGGAASRQGNNNQKDRRRPLMFKSTEASTDKKIVAGLRKVVCSTYEEALTVLETGLTERKVTGTGSNSVSSRSHGFFCVEVKNKVIDRRFGEETWIGNTLTIVDLAGMSQCMYQLSRLINANFARRV